MTTLDSLSPTTRPRRARWAGGVATGLRLLATVHVVLVLAQPVLAGGYLGGDYDQLALHARNADLVSYTGYLLLVAGLALALLGGARWPLLALVALNGAETGQYLAGLGGSLALHVPLGVAIVAACVVLLAGLWTTRAAHLADRRAAA